MAIRIEFGIRIFKVSKDEILALFDSVVVVRCLREGGLDLKAHPKPKR